MPATRYELTRDAIKVELEAVPQIGKIYDSPKFSSDWPSFLGLHLDADRIIRVGWFTLVSATESNLSDSLAAQGADDEIHWINRTEVWSLEQFIGYKDDANEPTDYKFQLLAQAIEERFRFEQNLNGQCHICLPLNRVYSAPWMLGNQVLVHRAEWRLTVIHRIMNPN